MINFDRLNENQLDRLAQITTEESHPLLHNMIQNQQFESCGGIATGMVFGNLRYALTLPLRIIALVKDTLMFAVRLAVNIVFLPVRWRHILPDLRDASIALVGSIMHVAINVLGIVASPLAYFLDRTLLQNTPTLVQRALLKHCTLARLLADSSNIRPQAEPAAQPGVPHNANTPKRLRYDRPDSPV